MGLKQGSADMVFFSGRVQEVLGNSGLTFLTSFHSSMV